MNVERLAEKSSKNLLNSIDQSKNNSFDKLIYALGINEVGITTAKSLARTFENMDSLMSASVDELCLIDDIGDVVAKNIHSYFKDDNNKINIKKLLKLGLLIDYTTQNHNTKLSGKTYAITGSFINFSRQDIEQLVLSNGGKVTSSISKKTSALILGSKPGSKLGKAKKLNIAIINEGELSKLL